MFALAVKGGFTIKCPFYEEKGERIRIGLFGIVLQMNGGEFEAEKGGGGVENGFRPHTGTHCKWKGTLWCCLAPNIRGDNDKTGFILVSKLDLSVTTIFYWFLSSSIDEFRFAYRQEAPLSFFITIKGKNWTIDHGCPRSEKKDTLK